MNNISLIEQKLKDNALPDAYIQSFLYYYNQLVNGETGIIKESDIIPVEDVADAESFAPHYHDIGKQNISKVAVIKLNGGLGTSMGLMDAKSLLEVRDSFKFMDIVAKQAMLHTTPLILMNSFATSASSLKFLKKYPNLISQEMGIEFLQHKAPKILVEDLSPATWIDNPSLEWNPPGHGDIYLALYTSKILEKLLDHGYKYAFVSNIDNLGADVDYGILGYIIKNNLSFLMEVCDRTNMDRKGGHIARLKDGRLILREVSQCSKEDLKESQNIKKHKYYNTNNLWIDLEVLFDMLNSNLGIMKLPLIRNEKNIDPRNRRSPKVYQLETAMGCAISIFKQSEAIRVSRDRFSPVKTTNDLLAVRSDAYQLTSDFRIIPNHDNVVRTPYINLDPEYYKFVDEMETHFPAGVPSLTKCKRFEVIGDVIFSKKLNCIDKVKIINESGKQKIFEKSEFSGEFIF